MKTCINLSLPIFMALVLMLVAVSIEARKCKKVKSALVTCGLVARGMRVGGTVNGTVVEERAYGSFVNVNNNIAVATNQDIPFTNDTVSPVGMEHGAAPFTSITLNQSGTYMTWYKVRTNDMIIPVTAQLYRNGSPIVGSADSGVTAVINKGIIFMGNAGDIITLRNIGLPQLLATPNLSSQPVDFFFKANSIAP